MSCCVLGVEVPGVKQVFYGICLLLVVVLLPNGIWPPLSRALGLDRDPDDKRGA